MKEKHIQIFGIVISIVYFALIVWVYAYQPQSLTDAATKATVTIGTYQIDKVKFEEGVGLFRQDNFPAAREAFQKADPEKKDANTQFYIAYSFYRQGWGRISNDDALYKHGIEAVNNVIAIDAGYRSADESLKMKTPAELKSEFEEGLKVTADDFNPLKAFRERK